MKENILQTSLAEAIGTFLLVFFGCGSIVVNQIHNGSFGLFGIAITYGLLVMVLILSIGHISGAHINPAVSIAFACMKRISWSKAGAYIVAQLIGATLGALLLKCLLANGDSLGTTVPTGGIGRAFALEVIMTALLMFVVISVATDARARTEFSAIAIGSVIIIDILIGGTITGASMNPARSIGPALVQMEFQHLWLYIVAPILGALLGGMGYAYFAPPRNS